ncbi:uncharacterized protein LOC100376661 [Saccoglossus kowalevskii]|uniref:Uncharacterized protein LOC100376661 n=1 Tax=Saccoglossus kowalevskii TaxID=10224 RepID=A0ABM0GLP9_SACKO|nr:PREDICTED: uncharacterized protein LOC100376661 [Saccoglossus kowalevskii]
MADNKPMSKIIQNIDEVIKKWALKGKDNQDKYVVEIVKNGLEFMQIGEINYKAVKKMVPCPDNPNEYIPSGAEAGEATPNTCTRTVHTTSFVNATSAAEQKHHFRVERTNTTCYSWSMSSGHTFSSRAGISLTPPNACIEASVEFGKTTEESTEEVNASEKTRTNVIECDVIVPKGKRVNVNLNITEEDLIAKYDVEYRIEGEVTVIIKKGEKIDSDRHGQAQDIFRGMDGFKVFPKTEKRKGFAKFINKGIFMSKREIRQELEMRDEDL